MREYVKKLILSIENNKRVAVTKKYPFLLFPVIEMKRFYKKVNYTYPNSYNLKHTKASVDQKWFHITEHSSPLYRKYNKRELDDGKIKNIKIAIQKLDGLIIEPKQIFSFWKYVGRTNKSRGFSKSSFNLPSDKTSPFEKPLLLFVLPTYFQKEKIWFGSIISPSNFCIAIFIFLILPSSNSRLLYFLYKGEECSVI